jgi:hypothetical protein
MKIQKQILPVMTAAVFVYHIAAVVKDVEQWMANARQARDNPSLDTLAALVLASGIMVIDFGRL